METESHSSIQNNNFKLQSELELHEFKDQFVIRSLQFPDQAFSITRSDGTFHKIQGLFLLFYFNLIYIYIFNKF